MNFYNFPQIANRLTEWQTVKEVMATLGWTPPYMSIYSILRQAVEAGYLELHVSGWGTQRWRQVQ